MKTIKQVTFCSRGKNNSGGGRIFDHKLNAGAYIVAIEIGCFGDRCYIWYGKNSRKFRRVGAESPGGCWPGRVNRQRGGDFRHRRVRKVYLKSAVRVSNWCILFNAMSGLVTKLWSAD